MNPETTIQTLAFWAIFTCAIIPTIALISLFYKPLRTKHDINALFIFASFTMIAALILSLLLGDAIVKERPAHQDGIDTTTFIINHS